MYIQRKLIPDIEQKIGCILGMYDIKGVAELESVFIETENVEFLIMKMTI
jgi:hypothetical protein